MLKRLFFAAALLAASPALADSITVTIVSTVPGASGTLTRSMTLTQGDMGIFISGLEAATSTATATTAADAWLGSLKSEVVRIGQGWQNSQALAGITPINPQ